MRTDRQTDSRDKTKSRFSQNCEKRLKIDFLSPRQYNPSRLQRPIRLRHLDKQTAVSLGIIYKIHTIVLCG